MRSLLGPLCLALTLAPVPATLAGDPLPADAELEGLYPVEQDIIDEIATIAPDFADDLREELPGESTFEGRARHLDEEARKLEKKLDKIPFADEFQKKHVYDRVLVLASRLLLAYGYPRAERSYLIEVKAWRLVGSTETESDPSRRPPRDMSSLSAGEKRLLAIPLTVEEKSAPGMDDLTLETKMMGGYPLTLEEIKALAEQERQENRTILPPSLRQVLEESEKRDQGSSHAPEQPGGGILFKPRDVDGGEGGEGGHGDGDF